MLLLSFPETLLILQRFSLREKYPYLELFWSAFSCIRIEHGEILRISPYSVQMRENADQNNWEYGHFLRSVFLLRVIRKAFNQDENSKIIAS